LELGEPALPWLAALALLWLIRRQERWLHQHLFKVGWLITGRLSTTTVVYYLLFLPGIILHELIVWFTATVINVNAHVSMRIPGEQSVAELKLEFVKLAKTTRVKRAVLALMPVLAGISVIEIIASQALRFQTAASLMAGQGLQALPQAIQSTTTQPGFWLWAYVIFTIANTMFPADLKQSFGGRWAWLVLGGTFGIILLAARGNDALAIPFQQAGTALFQSLVLVAALDLLVTTLLRIIEEAIERTTRRSATFTNGKLVALTREQVLAQAAQKRQKQQKAAPRPADLIQSVYDLPFPMPVPQSRESASEPVAASPVIPGDTGRAGASLIVSEPLNVSSRVSSDVELADDQDAG
jgi:hypothetical protein